MATNHLPTMRKDRLRRSERAQERRREEEGVLLHNTVLEDIEEDINVCMSCKVERELTKFENDITRKGRKHFCWFCEEELTVEVYCSDGKIIYRVSYELRRDKAARLVRGRKMVRRWREEGFI